MDARSSFVGGPDVLLALYYEGGTGGLFDSIGPEPEDDDLEVSLCEAVLEADPDHVEALAFLGNHYTRGGRHERGLKLDLRLIRLRPGSARAHYNVACSYALLGRREDALKELEIAVECGFYDADHLARDDDIASLRDDPRFEKLLLRLKAASKKKA